MPSKEKPPVALTQEKCALLCLCPSLECVVIRTCQGAFLKYRSTELRRQLLHFFYFLSFILLKSIIIADIHYFCINRILICKIQVHTYPKEWITVKASLITCLTFSVICIRETLKVLKSLFFFFFLKQSKWWWWLTFIKIILLM